MFLEKKRVKCSGLFAFYLNGIQLMVAELFSALSVGGRIAREGSFA